MLLEGTTALITGASKGIGKAISELFASEGANLVLLSRDAEALNTFAESLREENGRLVYCYQCDVRHLESVKAVFKELAEKGVFIDVLVNNAGIMIDATLQMVKDEVIHNIYETNVFGTIYCSQLALKPFLRRRKGSIINLSSIIGTNGNLGQTIYGSSKAAVIGFTKSLSKELAPLNIRVNAIAPGFIDTDMTKGMNPEFYEKNLASIGMRRIGTPSDVAKVALFLASGLSEYVTGQVIGVDGGMII
jgi:3-oxoacyl-[acyl-carrier protein] reductase